MSLIKSEKTNPGEITLEFSVDKETFKKAISDAYRKNVGKITIPGFRKGKAPRAMIEKMYGKGFFYEDAFNAILPDAFEAALEESKVGVTVGQPEFDVVSADEENGVVFTAKVFLKPDPEIKDYLGIKAEKKVARVTKAEIEEELKTIQERNSREIEVTDGVSAMGDVCTIDYEGSVDGVPFDGGKGEGYPLKLGSGNFIPGFEEQVAGHKLEEEFDVNVTFPEEYHAKELAGKAAVFKTVIHKIAHIELPELDDDFAKDVSEFDTIDEYRADIKAKIAKRHEAEAEEKFESAIMETLMNNLVADIPEAMYVAETENFVRDYDNRLRMQGLDLKTYFQYTGMTLETLREQMRPQAERQVKLRLALEKIAALEALEATEEEINGEYESIANSYNVPVDQVKASIDASAIAEDMKVKKAMDLVKETAKITKPRKPAAKKKAAEAEATETVETENTEA